jgi:hypothetical protein
LESFEWDGAPPLDVRREGLVLKVKVLWGGEGSRDIAWKAKFGTPGR